MTTTSPPTTFEIPTAHGPARVHLHPAAGGAPRAALVLGHGAGGGVDAPDLLAVTEVATALGITVALVEQPYRVAGRGGSPRAEVLDGAWRDVVGHLTGGPIAGVPLITGGRSAGARVACRTALATGAAAVLALAFPLRPPGRPEAPSRLPELDGAGVPVLVVQGDRDPYGEPQPDPARRREVVVTRGDHSLRQGLDEVRAVAGRWLGEVWGAPAGRGLPGGAGQAEGLPGEGQER